MNRIDLVVTSISPLFVAYPDNYNDTKKLSQTLKKEVMSGDLVFRLPYYPANGFRGGLRRKAAARLLAHLKAVDGPVSGELYLGLCCGASSGSPDQTPLSVEEIIRARDNVYMGLFGGGARLHQSMYRVSDLTPILGITTAAGVVPDGLLDVAPSPATPKDILGRRTPIRVDDLKRVMDPAALLAYVADPVAAWAAHTEGVLASGDRRRADDTGTEKKEDVANMMTMETVAAGVPFHVRFDLDPDLSDAQLGLLLVCIEDLFQENAFGGWTRCGFGKFRANRLIVSYADQTRSFQPTNEVGEFVLPAELQPYVDAAAAAEKGIRLAEMASYFEDFSADKKAEKAAQAKAKRSTAKA